MFALWFVACGQSESTPIATNPSPTAALEPTVTLALELREYVPADCRFDVSEDSEIECGYLVVPEDRSRPDSAMIRLHVAVAQADSESAKPDPLLFLSGGPGSPSLIGFHWMRGQLSESLQDRDFVVLDQRGVGFSGPSLDCPERDEMYQLVLGQVLGPEERLALQYQVLERCQTRLVAQGVELSAYHSVAMAADVIELMQALGYDSYNLFGVSYGSRVALTVMRDHPAGLRSVVLDSVVPLQVNLFEEWALARQRAFDLLFERCRTDPECSEAFPGLEEAFYSLLDQLEQEPITVSIPGGQYQVAAADLAWIVQNELYDTDQIPHLPKELNGLLNGETVWLAQELSQMLVDRIFEGLNLSVMCHEETPFNSLEVIEGLASNVHPSLLVTPKDRVELCEHWDSGVSSTVESESVISDIPVLLLAGDYDPATPPAWAAMVAADMVNARHYEFLGVGHGVVTSRRCAQDIMAQFIEAPTEEPDVGCLDALRIGFVTR